MFGGGINRSGVDPPLSSSRACLTAFIASQFRMYLCPWDSSIQFCPFLPESGKGWLSSTGFGALSP